MNEEMNAVKMENQNGKLIDKQIEINTDMIHVMNSLLARIEKLEARVESLEDTGRIDQ